MSDILKDFTIELIKAITACIKVNIGVVILFAIVFIFTEVCFLISEFAVKYFHQSVFVFVILRHVLMDIVNSLRTLIASVALLFGHQAKPKLMKQCFESYIIKSQQTHLCKI